jgi:branched-subunit amino acid permease
MVKGWRGYEKIVLALAYIFPLEARNLNEQAGLPLTPFMVAMLFLVVLTRAAKD